MRGSQLPFRAVSQSMVLSAEQQNSPAQYIYFACGRSWLNTAVGLAKLGAVDLAYDSFRHILWASTADDSPIIGYNSGFVPSQPNSILGIDPVSRNVVSVIPCGSSAYRIALSVNGRYLWLALEDGTVRRLNLETKQIELALQPSALFPVSNEYGGVQVMAPSPVDEEVLVITPPNFNGYQNPVWALRGSSRLPFLGPPDSYAVFNNDGTLWTEHHLLAMTPQGPQVKSTLPLTSGFSAPVVMNVNGSLLAGDGSLRRSSDLSQIGLLASGVIMGAGTQGTPGVVYAPDTGLAYFSGALGGAANYTIQAFDPVRMVPVGQFSLSYFGLPQNELPNEVSAARVVTIGAEGFAAVFSMSPPNGDGLGGGGAIIFTPRSLLQPLPNASVPSLPANGKIREFPFVASSATIDPQSSIVYLSVPSAVPGFGNSIVPFDTTAGRLGQPVWAGSEPGVGVVSSDERYLYVNISGSYSVDRFELPNLSLDMQFQVYADYTALPGGAAIPIGTPVSVTGLLNLPGAPSTTITVQRTNLTGLVPLDQGVAIYDNGVKRSDTTAVPPPPYAGPAFRTNSAQFSPQGDLLFAIDDQQAVFSQWRVTSSGFEQNAHQAGLEDGLSATLQCFNGQSTLCVTSSGFLVDPLALTTVRIFGSDSYGSNGSFAQGTVVAVDAANDRVYFFDGEVQVSAFAISTGHPTGTLLLNLNMTDQFATQMLLLPSGELMILATGSILTVPTNLIH